MGAALATLGGDLMGDTEEEQAREAQMSLHEQAYYWPFSKSYEEGVLVNEDDDYWQDTDESLEELTASFLEQVRAGIRTS
jgi:hypothetical protein